MLHYKASIEFHEEREVVDYKNLSSHWLLVGKWNAIMSYIHCYKTHYVNFPSFALIQYNFKIYYKLIYTIEV